MKIEKPNDNQNNFAETAQPEEWIDGALAVISDWVAFSKPEAVDAEPPDEAFMQRCRVSVQAALIISKLREERQRIGFVPLPLADYLQGLAKVANTSMAPLLEWLGIANLSGLDASAGALIRLARDIGCSLRETLAYARITLAGLSNSVPVAVLVARHRSAALKHNQLEACEYALTQIESEYDDETFRRMRQVEVQVRTVYAAQDDLSV